MILPTDDLDQIMTVMLAAFAPAYGEAWNRRQVEDSLLVGSCHYGLIAAHGGEVAMGEPAAGFYLARDGFEESELLLLGVDPAQRHKGLGRRLLEKFAATAKANGARRLLLEMRRGNPAETLYRGFGFMQIGERPKYYRTADGKMLDALTFAYDCD